MIGLELEPLSNDERLHEDKVRSMITAVIAASGGWISFSDFMNLALYAPGLGYYAAGAHKLGIGGDFATAPELSPIFGRCIATQCEQVLTALGGGEILELGAGTGALAVDILEQMNRDHCLPTAYRILEPSPELRVRQQQRLRAIDENLSCRVSWLDSLPADTFCGVILANEVLDALPVECFQVTKSGVENLGVIAAGNGFAWTQKPANAALIAAVSALATARGADFVDGYRSELCLSLEHWLAAVLKPLKKGVALFVDYGLSREHYYEDSRAGGTLACYHRQRQHHNPFLNVGLQDITAWVDFTRVADAAVALGLTIEGYTTQANFLVGLGFDKHLSALGETLTPANRIGLTRSAARLVMPHEMGETFKCMALGRDYLGALRGFSARDFTASL
jgi:SAM-dependent MidA family methyltransferase